MNNAINEIKNTVEATNSRITEAEDRDEMVEWHHHLDGHEFEQALGDSEEQEAWHAAVHGVTKSQT